MYKTLATALLIGGLGLSSASFAETGSNVEASPASYAERYLQRHAERLQLDPQQQQQMRELHQRHIQQYRQLHEQHRSEMQGILNADQQKAWQEMREERRERAGKRRERCADADKGERRERRSMRNSD